MHTGLKQYSGHSDRAMSWMPGKSWLDSQQVQERIQQHYIRPTAHNLWASPQSIYTKKFHSCPAHSPFFIGLRNSSSYARMPRCFGQHKYHTTKAAYFSKPSHT